MPHHCLLNCLFRRNSKKTSKLRITGDCVGNSLWPVNSPHKGPVTRKMFPFDDVIMETVCLIPSSQTAKTLGSSSVRHRSDTFVSDRCLIDGYTRVFVIWDVMYVWFCCVLFSCGYLVAILVSSCKLYIYLHRNWDIIRCPSPSGLTSMHIRLRMSSSKLKQNKTKTAHHVHTSLEIL